MLALLEFARTWLLERMYTRPSASRTRAPIVPAVIAGCPTEKPMGAGRWRCVGSLKAIKRLRQPRDPRPLRQDQHAGAAVRHGRDGGAHDAGDVEQRWCVTPLHGERAQETGNRT